MEEFLKIALPTVVAGVGSSNNLVSNGTSFEYYNSFPAFRSVMNALSLKVLKISQSLINYQDCKGNVMCTSSSSATRDSDEAFESLVDVNDQLLEKIGTYLDEAEGIRKVAATFSVSKSGINANTSRGNFGISNTSFTGVSRRLGATNSSTSTRGATFASSKVNIVKPQLGFTETMDNSRGAKFVPKLTNKPNQLKSLQESVIKLPDDSFTHPYEYEIQHCQPLLETRDKHFQMFASQIPNSIDKSSDLNEITSAYELELLIKELENEEVIAIDVEHHSYRSYQGITCLVQISTRTEDYILDVLDPLLRDSMHLLNTVFTAPHIVKVFHGAFHDVLWLQRDFGLYIVNMWDTAVAARVLGSDHCSLGFLLSMYCNVNVDKSFQLADWRVRPLPADMKEYARCDTHYLLYVYALQRRDLWQKSLLCAVDDTHYESAVWEKSSDICLSRYEKPQFNSEDYLTFMKKSRKQLDAQRIYALQHLYDWRDAIARHEDECVQYVMPDHMLLTVIDILPREYTGVLACRSPTPALVSKYVHDIHRIVLKARELRIDVAGGSNDGMKSELSRLYGSNGGNVIVPKAANCDIIVTSDKCPHDINTTAFMDANHQSSSFSLLQHQNSQQELSGLTKRMKLHCIIGNLLVSRTNRSISIMNKLPTLFLQDPLSKYATQTCDLPPPLPSAQNLTTYGATEEELNSANKLLNLTSQPDSQNNKKFDLDQEFSAFMRPPSNTHKKKKSLLNTSVSTETNNQKPMIEGNIKQKGKKGKTKTDINTENQALTVVKLPVMQHFHLTENKGVKKRFRVMPQGVNKVGLDKIKRLRSL